MTVLHLPHLGCGREGLRAVAGLVRARPLVALNLAGSWGTRRDDPPSSSGVSVGKPILKNLFILLFLIRQINLLYRSGSQTYYSLES